MNPMIVVRKRFLRMTGGGVLMAAFLSALSACAAADRSAEGEELFITRNLTPPGSFTSGVEGPAVDAQGNLYAVNYERQHTIGRVSPDGEASVFVELPEGSIANGIRFTSRGEMLLADYVNHNVLKVDMATREITVYAHEPRMSQPNDLAIGANDLVYASDPNWKESTGQLWRVDHDGTAVLLEGELGTTNGIEVSPDGTKLYVNESVQRNVWVYDLSPEGEVSNKRLLIQFPDHGMDGMRCDIDGNIYITRYGKGTVAIVSPEGELLREVPIAEGRNPSNLAFGGPDGRTVYITVADRGNVQFFRTDRPGRSWGLLSAGPAPTSPVPVAALQHPDTVPIQEWLVPWADTRPRDPYVGPDGTVWFVGQTGHYVGNLDPRTGQFRRFELDEGTGPHNLIVDALNQVWYSGNLTGHIGKLDPATGQVTRYPMPDAAARDPHTLIFNRAGDIWFTLWDSNMIGKMETTTGKIHLVPVPTPGARPNGIVLDAAGRPWLNLLGTNKLATVDPATMELHEITLPREDARTPRIAMTSDGAVWYVDNAQGHLGRYDPSTNTFKEWPTPGGTGSQPFALAADDRDRLWFVEGGSPNRLIGFDPRGEEFFSNTPIPSGGEMVRNMVYHAPTREIWFGTDTNRIGRARIP
jgi:virginiamycin B lyase